MKYLYIRKATSIDSLKQCELPTGYKLVAFYPKWGGATSCSGRTPKCKSHTVACDALYSYAWENANLLCIQ